MSEITIEIWKDIEGYEGWYQVSSLGRVKSLSRIGWRGKPTNELILRHYDHHGYDVVFLYTKESRGKHKRKFMVHVLVGTAFCPRRPEHTQVNHKKKNRKDNRASELEWMTHMENMVHRDTVDVPF